MAWLGVVMGSWSRCGMLDNMYYMHTHIYAQHMGCVAMYYVCITACRTASTTADILDTPKSADFGGLKMGPKSDPSDWHPQNDPKIGPKWVYLGCIQLYISYWGHNMGYLAVFGLYLAYIWGCWIWGPK